MPLTLRPTRIAGQRCADDYCVHDDGMMIGRIMTTGFPGGEKRWTWFLHVTMPPRQGVADRLDDAKAAFRAAWARHKPEMAPEGLAELRQRQQTVDRRFE